MNRVFHIGILAVLILTLISCNRQNQNISQQPSPVIGRVGGDCEAGYCDLMYLGMPKKINAIDTSTGWFEKGQKLLVTGTVYQMDGKTPAPNVVVYYHHTDNDGLYSPKNDKPENKTRHGHLRGWIKTGSDGKYSIYTIRPVPYPKGNIPAHIHWLIKEPNIKNEYWVDDLVFEDDELMSPYYKSHPVENRGGNGIVKVTHIDNLQITKHDFILGLNVPNYPKSKK